MERTEGEVIMQGVNPLTMQCTYETPCGWCSKWDKKCDKQIGCEPKEEDIPCKHCARFVTNNFWGCMKCNGSNGYKYYIPYIRPRE